MEKIVNEEKVKKSMRNLKRKKSWKTSDDKENHESSCGTTMTDINESTDSYKPFIDRHKPKRLRTQEIKSKPSVLMDSCVEFETKDNLINIHNEMNGQYIDSAGNKFDNQYFMRNRYRNLLMDALTTGDQLFGCLNPSSIALGIESIIFNILKIDLNSYKTQCNECIDFIGKNRQIRLELLMGRLVPKEFVFMPIINGLNLEKLNNLRNELKETSKEAKLKKIENYVKLY